MKLLRLALTALACVPVLATAAEVEFVNKSNWSIHEIYFSPANQSSWGEDHLGHEVLEMGDSLTLTDVEPGRWDVLVVDEDGDRCVIEGVQIQASDRWVINDNDLLACQAAS